MSATGGLTCSPPPDGRHDLPLAMQTLSGSGGQGCVVSRVLMSYPYFIVRDANEDCGLTDRFVSGASIWTAAGWITPQLRLS
jgi:hypothetical protein